MVPGPIHDGHQRRPMDPIDFMVHRAQHLPGLNGASCCTISIFVSRYLQCRCQPKCVVQQDSCGEYRALTSPITINISSNSTKDINPGERVSKYLLGNHYVYYP